MEPLGRLKSFLRKVMIDGFSRQEQAIILKWLRLVIFVSITLLLVYTLSGLTNMSEILASPRLPSGARDDRSFLRLLVIMFGVPFWLFIGLYWIGNLLDKALLFTKSNLIHPLSKRIRKIRRRMRNAVTDTRLWKLHSRIYYFFGRIGKRHLLLRSLRYLEPELNSQETTVGFDPQTIDLAGTTITAKMAGVIFDRYQRFSVLVAFLCFLGSILLIPLATRILPPLGANSNFFLNIVSILGTMWIVLIWVIALLGFLEPINTRERAWYSVQKSLRQKEYRLSIATKAEGDLGQRIEELKVLYENEAKNLKATQEELAQLERSLDQVNNLAQNEQQTIVYLVNTVLDLGKRRQEALEKMLRPQQIIRDLLVGVASNLIWGLIGGFILGWLVGASR
jgi:hypothetical protein